MQRPLWLSAAAFLLVVGGAGTLYLAHPQTRPALLPLSAKGQPTEWCYESSLVANPRVSLCATKMSHTGDATVLEGLTLKIFHPGAATYDEVHALRARLDESTHVLSTGSGLQIQLASLASN